MRRVVVTGMGIVSPIGNSVEEFKESLLEGKNGIETITDFPTDSLKVKVSAKVKNFDPLSVVEKKDIRRYDTFTLYALKAAKEAVEDSGILDSSADRNRIGVYVGSGIGGINVFSDATETMRVKGPSRVSPFFIPSMISNMASGIIAMKFGLKGPTLPIVTACATSTNAIGEAYRNIKDGYSDAILAGGTEAAITPLTIAGFTNLTALSQEENPDRASVPFSKERTGFVMGEGAAVLLLEEYESAVKRGAHIYAEIAGYGNTCDAYHITAPDPEGEGAVRAMREALCEGVDPEKLWYNAHGTSTKLNDLMETKAVKEVFGDKAYDINISSIKSMTGHMLGAAGACEAVASVLSVKDDFIPPTINYLTPDEELDLNYTPDNAVHKETDWSLSSSFGFGGHNAVILIKKVK